MCIGNRKYPTWRRASGRYLRTNMLPAVRRCNTSGAITSFIISRPSRSRSVQAYDCEPCPQKLPQAGDRHQRWCRSSMEPADLVSLRCRVVLSHGLCNKACICACMPAVLCTKRARSIEQRNMVALDRVSRGSQTTECSNEQHPLVHAYLYMPGGDWKFSAIGYASIPPRSWLYGPEETVRCYLQGAAVSTA